MASFDLVIRGGRIADGSGGDIFTGDVAVKDGLVAEVGEVTAKGAREITLDRDLIENVIDTLEIFTDDCEVISGGTRERAAKGEQKPVVARLN